MAKKCIICNAEATFCVKGSSDTCYCHDCATDQFGDVTYLISVQEQAKLLRHAIDEIDGEIDSKIPGEKTPEEE